MPGDDGAPVDFVVVAANAAFATQTGVPVEGIVGRRAIDAIPGIRDSDVLEAAVQVVSSGVSERFETFYKEVGRHLDIQFATPRPGQLAVVVLDVTERRQAEGILSGFFADRPWVCSSWTRSWAEGATGKGATRVVHNRFGGEVGGG